MLPDRPAKRALKLSTLNGKRKWGGSLVNWRRTLKKVFSLIDLDWNIVKNEELEVIDRPMYHQKREGLSTKSSLANV